MPYEKVPGVVESKAKADFGSQHAAALSKVNARLLIASWKAERRAFKTSIAHLPRLANLVFSLSAHKGWLHNYLSFDTFETGFRPTDEEFKARLRSNVLNGCTARNWGPHAHTSPIDGEKLIHLSQ